MPQTQRVMVAYTTFKIMIQSLTLHFMMTMISLPRICVVYMVEDAIIQKNMSMIQTTMAVAIMKQILTRVAYTIQTHSSHQMLVVSIRTELKLMTMTIRVIAQMMSAITIKTTMDKPIQRATDAMHTLIILTCVVT